MGFIATMSIIQTKSKSSGFYRNFGKQFQEGFLQRFEEGIFQWSCGCVREGLSPLSHTA